MYELLLDRFNMPIALRRRELTEPPSAARELAWRCLRD